MRSRTDFDWISQALADFPPLCTLDECMAVLRCSRRTAYRLTASGRLHSVRAGVAGSARVLVPRSSLEAYLRSLEAA